MCKEIHISAKDCADKFE